MFDPIMTRQLAQIRCQERPQSAEQARQPYVQLDYNPSLLQRIRINLAIHILIWRRRLRASAARPTREAI